MSKVSDDKSIDIGYITENDLEFEELKEFFNKFIKDSVLVTENVQFEKPTFAIEESLSRDISKRQISNFSYVNDINNHMFNCFRTLKRKIGLDLFPLSTIIFLKEDLICISKPMNTQ